MNGVKTIAYSNVLSIYSGEVEISEGGEATKIRRGECAFIRRDNRVSLIKRPVNGKQFKAIILSFTRKFLREFYHRTLDKNRLPTKSERRVVSVYKLPANRTT